MTKQPSGPVRVLGVETGATRTVAVLEECDPASLEGSLARELQLGPANLRLLDQGQLRAHFRKISRAFPILDTMAIGMAGARTEADRSRMRLAAAKVWPGVPCYATHDLETALMAADPAFQRRAGAATRNPQPATCQVLILSGTGSCCFGRTWDGKKTARVGGWGHVLGDKGSGFEIGLRALKAVVYYYDRDGEWSDLGRRILRKLQLNEPDDLIGWVQNAGKDEVAALAVEVFIAWSKRDKIASDILAGAADSLAGDGVSCARRLVKPGTRVRFVLAGGVLLNQPRFAGLVAARLRKSWPKSVVTPLQRESVWGAVELAKHEFQKSGARVRVRRGASGSPDDSSAQLALSDSGEQDFASLESSQRSPTEQRNLRSLDLDKLPIAQAISLMLSEDAKIPAAILEQGKKIEQAIRRIVRAFRRGGRLFYVGTGTSGRLGVLDASECPPTFSAPPDQVQGIIAGGQRALWESVEGAEDDADAGARTIQLRDVGLKDVVVGIAASGRTPFVWGALREAGRRGAKTVLLCFNPRLEIPRRHRPDLIIAPDVGSEILTGSTRLKCGTATKLILNIFTTLAMVQTGKVISNLMIDLNPSNVKLRDRAVRIVHELTGADAATAVEALEKCGWVVRKACLRLRPNRRPSLKA